MDLRLGRVTGVGGRVEQGSTIPIYGSVDLDGFRERVILKLALYETKVPVEAVINEWISTKLAEAAGVLVANGWLTTIPEDRVSYIEETFAVRLASRLAFATKDSAIDALLVPDSFSAVDDREPIRLFGLDMLLLNSDRIESNPNCGKVHRRLFAYDFGSALPSRGAQLRSFERGFFAPNLNDRAANHLCRGYVRDTDELRRSLGETNRAFDEVSSTLVERLREGVPDHGPHAELLESYFAFLSASRDMTTDQIVNTVR